MNEVEAIQEFFGLRENPFAPTADPVYFYATNAHKECLFRLWHCIDSRNGIAVVLGNYGTGKTTLLRKIITGMAADPERYNTAIVGSPIPSWTSFALLERIVSQFSLKPKKRSFASYMDSLNEYLLVNRNSICTLIIDDAQNLNKRGQLELLRLVQNLETHQHKLLNLVMFAQLEWIDVLRAAPNFEQRVSMTYKLPVLKFEDTRNFIDFRIRQAGGNVERAPVFEESALRAIYAHAEGNPRVIVTICRNALLVASQLRTRRVGQDIILHTLDKTTLPDAAKRERVRKTVLEHMKISQLSADRMNSTPVGGSGRRTAHEQRASRILLKAIQTRQAGGQK